MIAVIFTARIKLLDDEYRQWAEKLRNLAVTKYGCVDFISVTEGDKEISVSYWETCEQILEWKEDPEHQRAQQIGKEKWYRSYRVQVMEMLREYSD